MNLSSENLVYFSNSSFWEIKGNFLKLNQVAFLAFFHNQVIYTKISFTLYAKRFYHENTLIYTQGYKTWSEMLSGIIKNLMSCQTWRRLHNF
jgi:hypothetical protein